MKIILSLFALLFVMSVSASSGNPLPTASFVDVPRYVGKWYAVKALPQRFTKNCKGQTAEYEVINDTTISVFNTCIKAKGTTTIKGKATVVDKKANAVLAVKFNTWWNNLLPFIKGDYRIIKLDENYEYVMVGDIGRKSLWYLSRRPSMPEELIREYDALAKSLGFAVEKMVVSEF